MRRGGIVEERRNRLDDVCVGIGIGIVACLRKKGRGRETKRVRG